MQAGRRASHACPTPHAGPTIAPRCPHLLQPRLQHQLRGVDPLGHGVAPLVGDARAAGHHLGRGAVRGRAGAWAAGSEHRPSANYSDPRPADPQKLQPAPPAPPPPARRRTCAPPGSWSRRRRGSGAPRGAPTCRRQGRRGREASRECSSASGCAGRGRSTRAGRQGCWQQRQRHRRIAPVEQAPGSQDAGQDACRGRTEGSAACRGWRMQTLAQHARV